MTEINSSTLRSQYFSSRSFVRIGVFCLCGVLLTGCVRASNWLSGSVDTQNSLVDSAQYFAPMRIGMTTVKEVATRFGIPDDVQFGSIDGMQIESLGYSSNDSTMTPLQYVPFLGAFDIWKQASNRTPSAAISFSPVERLSGLTVSSHNAYGDIRPPGISTRVGSSISFYGMSNPAVFHTANASPEHLP